MGEGAEKPVDCQVSYQQFKSCFAGFSESEFKKLCSCLQYRKYSANSVIWEKGDPADFMGFLVKEKMVVKKETAFPGKYILLALLEEGALFGENSISSPSHKRTSTLVTEVVSHALLLTNENAQNFFTDNPSLGVKLLKNIVAVTSLRLQQCDSRLAELL